MQGKNVRLVWNLLDPLLVMNLTRLCEPFQISKWCVIVKLLEVDLFFWYNEIITHCCLGLYLTEFLIVQSFVGGNRIMYFSSWLFKSAPRITEECKGPPSYTYNTSRWIKTSLMVQDCSLLLTPDKCCCNIFLHGFVSTRLFCHGGRGGDDQTLCWKLL